MTDEKGNSQVIGCHRKTELMSDTLQKRLLDNGIPHKELQEFLQEIPGAQKTAAKKQPGKEAT